MAVFFEDDAFGTVPEGYNNTIGSWFQDIFTTEEGRARRDARRGAKNEGELSEAELKRAMAEEMRKGKQKDNTLLIVGIAAILVIGGIAAFALSKKGKK